MVVEPRLYIVYQRSFKSREELPEIVRECAMLSQAKQCVVEMVDGKPGRKLSKNGRSAHYFNAQRNDDMLVWIKRKRHYP